ncbi:MAG TPA: CerR family C-terminal domain-containing protein [Chthoniobacterales bacterium]|jgi:AcrR family transcriptional regulator|nr:CerR family C-terminal domain-containing protein [Chthoniobacterales bacterium]
MVVRERKAPEAVEENTRGKILSAAGDVFAEHGFEGATIRAITERAGVNIAAVNYHFRDKSELYTRVVLDACSLPAAWRSAADAASSPDERLRRLIYYFLRGLLDPERPAWKRRLMAREMSEPTEALDVLVENNIRPFRDGFLVPVLTDLTGGRCTDRQLSLLSASIMGQCIYYLQSQPIIVRLYPDFKLGNAEILEIAEHISRFSLAGIAGLNQQARRPS